MEKIVVIGGGGHAKVVIGILKRIRSFKILGYVDPRDNGEILGVPYLGADSVLAQIRKKYPKCSVAIGVGSVSVSEQREKIYNKIRLLGFKMPAVISPEAIVNENVSVGEGTVIVDGAVVNPGTTIGQCTIINTNSSVDHDSIIGDFVHIAPGVTVSGGVKVGKNSFLSVGSSVIQYKTIGANCMIGAGATVVKDCLEAGTYLGTPARLKKP